MTIRHVVASIPVLILAIAFACTMPHTAQWRDTGEFIVSAFFLDISHPAGFPLYAQLSNLSALLPLGPIAWRVHLASFAYCCICLLLSYRLTFYFLRQLLKIDSNVLPYFSILPGMLLISLPTFLKQSFSAEAYVLNCVGIQLLLLLYLRSMQTNDLRYLVTAAFFSGLLPGNHVTIVLTYIPVICIVVFRYKTYRKIILPSLFLLLCGAAIFAYIPVRAGSSPPLNTGGATSMHRTLNLMTNARDRALRNPVAATPVDTIREAPPSKEFLATLLLRLYKDLRIMEKEVPALILLFAVAGTIIVCIQKIDFGIIISWSLVSLWYFFKGWQPDPWIPIFFLTGFLATCFLSLFCQFVSDLSSRRLVYTTLTFIGLGVTALVTHKTLSEAHAASSSETSTLVLHEQLLNAPEHALLISETSYFLHAYAQSIEGFRHDLVLLYLHQIINPEYFAPFKLSFNTLSLIDSIQLNTATAEKNLALFIDRVAPKTVITIEPNSTLMKFLASVAQLDTNGLAHIRYQQPGGIARNAPILVAENLAKHGARIARDWQPFTWEGSHHIASLANAFGNALLVKEEPELAMHFYSTLCAGMHCNPVLKNNLASALLQTGHINKATALLEMLATQELAKHERLAVLSNLSLAYTLQKQGSNQGEKASRTNVKPLRRKAD